MYITLLVSSPHTLSKPIYFIILRVGIGLRFRPSLGAPDCII